MKYIGTKELETERLILRKVKKEDAEQAYQNWCNSSEVSKYVLWEKHNSIDITKKLYEFWENEYENLNVYRWIVQTKDTNELIGTIDVSPKGLIKYGACEIGYCYGEKYWGNGYATEALKAVIKFLFEECDANVVFAEHMSNNTASGKVMQKAGMKYEGVLRNRIIDKDNNLNDLISYSITKEEYNGRM